MGLAGATCALCVVAIVFAAGCNSGAFEPDAEPDAVARLDASPDAPLDLPDAAWTEDAGAVDAAPPDASPDAGCVCPPPSSDCVLSDCIGGTCVELPVADGTDCIGPDPMVPSVCVAGACVVRSCGDGFREPGPAPAREGCDDGNAVEDDACSTACTPLIFLVAARSDEDDLPRAQLATLGVDDSGIVLIVWFATTGALADLVAQRFTAAGVPVDATPFPLALGFASDWDAQATVTGLAEGWAVAWTSPTIDGDLQGIALRIVHADGSVDPALVANTTTFSTQNDPTIARVLDEVVVAWSDNDDAIRFRRFTATGTPIGGEVTATALLGGALPALAASPAGFLLTWTEVTMIIGDPPAVIGRRYDASGTALDAAGFLISDVAADGTELSGFSPAAAHLETGEYVVAFASRADDNRGDVRARRIPATGPVPADPSIVIAATPGVGERLPSVAPLAGSGFAVLYHEASPITDAIRDVVLVGVDAPLPPETAALPPFLEAFGYQQNGSLLRTPYGLWLTWSDDDIAPAAGDAFAAFLVGVP